MSKRNAERNAKGAGSAKTLAVGRKVATRSVKVSAPVASKGKPDVAPKAKAASTKRTAGKKMASRAKASSIVLPADYRPSEDEPFMNERQRMYFRLKLLAWKEEIIRQTRETLAGLHEESTQHADLADRATSETDRALELRARDRQRKLVAKIDAALARIEDGSYGYCEETGEPIGLKRLDARPIATLSVEAQERHERRERVYRED
jgi:DnaK suppressor protein